MTGTLTDGVTGLTATFTSNSGVFGSTGASFGIVNNLIDSGESFTVSFDQDVSLTQIDFANFNNTADALNLTIGAFPVIAADGTQTDDVFDIAVNNSLSAGQTILFEGVGTGNGVGITNFTVDTVTAVPEPSSLAILGMVVAGGLITRRRKCRR
jgi:hypothetical protein